MIITTQGREGKKAKGKNLPIKHCPTGGPADRRSAPGLSSHDAHLSRMSVLFLMLAPGLDVKQFRKTKEARSSKSFRLTCKNFGFIPDGQRL
jgi:hypothetical protein